jgi:hypothetical protein
MLIQPPNGKSKIKNKVIQILIFTFQLIVVALRAVLLILAIGCIWLFLWVIIRLDSFSGNIRNMYCVQSLDFMAKIGWVEVTNT